MASKHTASQSIVVPDAFSSFVTFFVKGAAAGLVVFGLVGGLWQVSHFWWVMAVTALSCGLINAVVCLEFRKTLDALMESLPWIL